MNNTWIYILVMAAVTFAIRVLPLTLIRQQIKNTFVRSFLYYVPYVTLAVMTFPAIMDATPDAPLVGLAALGTGLVAAYFGWDLFRVALTCCGTVLLLTFVF